MQAPPPPLVLAEEDRLDGEELAELVQRLLQLCTEAEQRCQGLPKVDAKYKVSVPVVPAEIGAFIESLAEMAHQIYPPPTKGSSSRWWACRHTGVEDFVKILFHVTHTLAELHRYFFMCVSSRQGQEEENNSAFLSLGVKRQAPLCVPCPFEDDARIFHRLIAHAIYYYRHVDMQLLLPEALRPLVDVTHDTHGVLPFLLSACGTKWWGIAYVTVHSDTTGRGTLVPLAIDGASLSGCTLVRCRMSKQECAVVLVDGHIQTGPGLCATQDAHFSNVFAVSGWPNFIQAPNNLGMPSAKVLASLGCPDAADRHFWGQPVFSMLKLIQSMLGNEWPAIGGKTWIQIPTVGLEQEVVELLLLEELSSPTEQDESDDDSDTRRAIIKSITDESHTTIAEVVQAQRTRLALMLHDQRVQLEIHSEAAERTRQWQQQNNKTLRQQEPSSTFSSSSASSSSSSSPQETTTSAPAWADGKCVQALETLLSAGRVKYRRVKKLLMAILRASPLKPDQSTQRGSHLVTHNAGASPWTLVEQHSGRSKDSVVTHSIRTRICSQLLSVVSSQTN